MWFLLRRHFHTAHTCATGTFCRKRTIGIVSGENQTERNVIATGARVQRIVYRLRLSAVTHSCVRATYPQAPVMITVHLSQPTTCSQLTTPAHVER